MNVWLFALLTYGVGDLVTSITLIWFSPDHLEGNPLIAGAISAFGGGGFLAVKLLAMFGCLGVSLWAGVQGRDALLFYGPPVMLGLFGGVVTTWNLWLLFTWAGLL